MLGLLNRSKVCPRWGKATWRTRLRVEELESRTVLSVLTPAQIRHAYGIDQIGFSTNGQTVAGDGAGQTIAIVDAYDDPSIQSDLAHFDSVFGLPNPVFAKATPQGQPAIDPGWSSEIALDVEWAHVVAPRANILLVEARAANLGDLLSAVDYARRQPGVTAVSMSWGGSEFLGESLYDSYFTTPSNHAGVTFLAASGDSGAWYGAEWPASSPNVVSVGGTSLHVVNLQGSYSYETAWGGSGGGFSDFEDEPTYQYGVQNTGLRTTPDVAYNANPYDSYWVYDSTGLGGWNVVGGTSAGAPQWAGLVAIANEGRALAGKGSLDGRSQTLYALYKLETTSSLSYYHDETSGGNGYAASAGYDLATGLGSPKANAVVSGLVNATGSGSALTFTASRILVTTQQPQSSTSVAPTGAQTQAAAPQPAPPGTKLPVRKHDIPAPTAGLSTLLFINLVTATGVATTVASQSAQESLNRGLSVPAFTEPVSTVSPLSIRQESGGGQNFVTENDDDEADSVDGGPLPEGAPDLSCFAAPPRPVVLVAATIPQARSELEQACEDCFITIGRTAAECMPNSAQQASTLESGTDWSQATAVLGLALLLAGAWTRPTSRDGQWRQWLR
jgi:hypothetical protein